MEENALIATSTREDATYHFRRPVLDETLLTRGRFGPGWMIGYGDQTGEAARAVYSIGLCQKGRCWSLNYWSGLDIQGGDIVGIASMCVMEGDTVYCVETGSQYAFVHRTTSGIGVFGAGGGGEGQDDGVHGSDGDSLSEWDLLLLRLYYGCMLHGCEMEIAGGGGPFVRTGKTGRRYRRCLHVQLLGTLETVGRERGETCEATVRELGLVCDLQFLNAVQLMTTRYSRQIDESVMRDMLDRLDYLPREMYLSDVQLDMWQSLHRY
jgi:hypothetical protein